MAEIIGHLALDAMRAYLSATYWAANSAESAINMTQGIVIGTGSFVMNAAAMAAAWGWPIFGWAAFRFR